MSPDQLDIARRLVASKKWRWVAGMAAVNGGDWEPHHGDRVIEWNDGLVISSHESSDEPRRLTQTDVPDIADFATAAILLRMAMEAWDSGPHFATAESPGDDGGWIISQYGKRTGWEHADLGAVAAMALLAAWEEKPPGA